MGVMYYTIFYHMRDPFSFNIWDISCYLDRNRRDELENNKSIVFRKQHKSYQEEIDLSEEKRMVVAFTRVVVKQIMALGYKCYVRSSKFQIGDLVLKRADIEKKNVRDGKLVADWEGLYRVQAEFKREAYLLESLKGE